MDRVRQAIAGATLVLTYGCATTFGGGGSQQVSIIAEPPAQFVISTPDGNVVASGHSPTTIKLSRKQEYLVRFSAPGYELMENALVKRTNGWYKANAVWAVGGVLALIPMAIDGSTGARWKLEPATLATTLVPIDSAAAGAVRKTP
jgi:hypothetical protein